MPQLHLYVPEEVAVKLRECAKVRGVSLSKYLAEVVSKEAAVGWPAGYFESVVGSWRGDVPKIDDPPPADQEAL